MGAYLIDNRPKTQQYRTRTEKPSGVVVVHTAESTPDWVDHDSGAENVTNFIVNRSDYGAYHALVDSDSALQLVPWHLCTYHDGTGSNDHSVGISAATQAAKWLRAPEGWRNATVKNMARKAAEYSKWLVAQGRARERIPARRITKAESDKRIPGFISHAERDPGRRTDPGEDFPWELFFMYYRRFTRPKRTPAWDAIWEQANGIASNTKQPAAVRDAARRVRAIAERRSVKY